MLVSMAIVPATISERSVIASGDDQIFAVDDGYIPRNISTLMGFGDLYDDGLNGSGVSIAILDTGVNWSHADLQHGLGKTTGMIAVNESFVPAETPMDHDGHGTFITGMLVGNGDSSSGDIIGMVPGAEIWNLKVLDSNGEGEIEWIENALDWILNLTDKPDIISMSFGASGSLPTIEEKIYQLWEEGVVSVIAAGNEGPEYYTIDSPGCVLDAFTVGACTIDEYLLSFSSEGPTSVGDYYKPDLVAYGVDIISTDLATGYVQGSGTSFSVPFISAGIALLMDATGGMYSPDEIKAAVIESCHLMGYYDYMEGAGIPDFSIALELLQNSSWNGVVTLPKIIEFPIAPKNDSDVSLNDYSLKVTAINSRYDGDVTVDVEGDIANFVTATIENHEGRKDQFIIDVHVLDSSLSFSSGSGTINIRDGDGTVLDTISVTIVAEGSFLFPLIIILVVIGFLIGIFAFFAVAYHKGTRAMPYNKCEIDGICPA
jgi:subtilisin family serine protease